MPRTVNNSSASSTPTRKRGRPSSAASKADASTPKSKAGPSSAKKKAVPSTSKAGPSSAVRKPASAKRKSVPAKATSRASKQTSEVPGTPVTRQQSHMDSLSSLSSSTEDHRHTLEENMLRAKTNLNEVRIGHKSKYYTVTQVTKGGNYFTDTIQGRLLAELRRLQRTTKLLIPRLPFCRLIKEITQTVAIGDYRYEHLAIDALQESAECFLIGIMTNSYRLTRHRGRLTLHPKDIIALLDIIEEFVPCLQK